MTVLIAVGGPHCHSTEVVKYGQSSNESNACAAGTRNVHV